MVTGDNTDSTKRREGGRSGGLIDRVNALAAELAELGGSRCLLAGGDLDMDLDLDLARAADAVRIDQIAALEILKSAACAVQACLTAAFAASQRARQEQAGTKPAQLGKGIPSQVGLARRESANKGARLAGFSQVLADEMPCTRAALARGEVNEWRAMVIVRETAVLSREDRAAVDQELCGPGGDAAALGDGALARAARAIGQRWIRVRRGRGLRRRSAVGG